MLPQECSRTFAPLACAQSTARWCTGFKISRVRIHRKELAIRVAHVLADVEHVEGIARVPHPVEQGRG